MNWSFPSLSERNTLSNTKAGHCAQLQLAERLPMQRGHLHGEEWKRVMLSPFSVTVIKHHEEFI